MTPPPNQPLASIVLPTWNGGRFLQSAIDSCLAQSWRNLELILVDDGSSDPQTLRILESQADPRILRLRQENQGLPRALNAGFARARGALLTWTSDDNRYRPEALETMAAVLLRGEADFVYAAATVVDGEGRETGPLQTREPGLLPLGNGIGACFLFTRAVWERTGEFDPSARLAEDYDYWVRVSRRFRMRRLENNLYLYRRHAHALTESEGAARVNAAVEAVRRRHFSAAEILGAQGLSAAGRGERAQAVRLLAGALLTRPSLIHLCKPLLANLLPPAICKRIARLKKRRG